MKCPECGKEIEPIDEEDEDSSWVRCPECGATWGHIIKTGFG